ncbi:MAG TPA: zinc ribbon domain-containing protein, partial [Candidatus Ozemobacteraceae bacterium]
MQCPGCGFENENDNKFCNMCGMALPASGGGAPTPLERAPLDLDLSLDLSDAGSAQAPASGGTPAGSLELGGFDLTPPSPGSVPDLSLDLGSTPGGSAGASLDLNLDAGADAKTGFDLSFDSNATPSGLELDTPSPQMPNLDLGTPIDAGGLKLDLGETPAEPSGNLDLGAFDTPAPAAEPAAPDLNIDFNLGSDTLSVDPASSPQAAPKPPAVEPFAPAAETPAEPPAAVEEMTFEISGGSSETTSFDFGDLD